MEVPNLEEIETAFKTVFPNERLQEVSYTPQENRVVLTIHSMIDNKFRVRTYQHTPGSSYKELFTNTPTLASV